MSFHSYMTVQVAYNTVEERCGWYGWFVLSKILYCQNAGSNVPNHTDPP